MLLRVSALPKEDPERPRRWLLRAADPLPAPARRLTLSGSRRTTPFQRCDAPSRGSIHAYFPAIDRKSEKMVYMGDATSGTRVCCTAIRIRCVVEAESVGAPGRPFLADVYDRWHKPHPKAREAGCAEHRSRTRRMVPTADRRPPTADRGIGKRWQVRHRDLDGQRRKANVETTAAAGNRATEVDVELRHGTARHVRRPPARQGDARRPRAEMAGHELRRPDDHSPHRTDRFPSGPSTGASGSSPSPRSGSSPLGSAVRSTSSPPRRAGCTRCVTHVRARPPGRGGEHQGALGVPRALRSRLHPARLLARTRCRRASPGPVRRSTQPSPTTAPRCRAQPGHIAQSCALNVP